MRVSRRKLKQRTFWYTRRLHVCLRANTRELRRHGIPNPQWMGEQEALEWLRGQRP